MIMLESNIGLKGILSTGRTEVRKIFNEAVSFTIQIGEYSVLKSILQHSQQHYFSISVQCYDIPILLERKDFSIMRMLIQKQVIVVYPSDYISGKEAGFSRSVTLSMPLNDESSNEKRIEKVLKVSDIIDFQLRTLKSVLTNKIMREMGLSQLVQTLMNFQ